MTRHACTILIADDDKFVRDDLKDILSNHYLLLFSATAAETFKVARDEKPDLVLLDVKFPDCQDLSLLQRFKRELPGIEIIMLTSQTENVQQIVNAIKLGAYDYVPKPFTAEELKNRIVKALELRETRREREVMLRELQSRSGLDGIIGSSHGIQTLRQNVMLLSQTDGCVLVRGESGTGKELVVRSLHYMSRRAGKPFIAVNCGSIPETLIESVLFGHAKGAFTGAIEARKGKFEAAEDGTIFLDEIGDMPISQQMALLRVLEYRTFTPVGDNRERTCRARFLLATNRDLRQRVQDGQFREDLYYRINIGALTLPTLRGRPEDIRELIEHYSLKISLELGRKPVRVSKEVLELFEKYDWPGNVRELKNVLEGAMMLLRPEQEELVLQDLPAEILAARSGEGVVDAKEAREREELIRALRDCDGNQSQAAKVLGVHRNTVRSRIRYMGLGKVETLTKSI